MILYLLHDEIALYISNSVQRCNTKEVDTGGGGRWYRIRRTPEEEEEEATERGGGEAIEGSIGEEKRRKRRRRERGEVRRERVCFPYTLYVTPAYHHARAPAVFKKKIFFTKI
jgi:hypothetical protein